MAINTVVRDAFREGVLTMTRSGFAVFTWALVTGIAMAKSGLTQSEAVGMSLLVYAGSAQLAALPLILGGYPIWTVLITAFVVNLRFVIFSVGMHPHFKDKSLFMRMVLGYMNGDITFALFTERFPEGGQHPAKAPFFLGMAITNWTFWQIGSLLGIFLAAMLPESWGLEFAGTLALIAIVMPMVDHGSAMFASITATAVALVTVGLPYKLNLAFAVIAAILVGLGVDRMRLRNEVNGS